MVLRDITNMFFTHKPAYSSPNSPPGSARAAGQRVVESWPPQSCAAAAPGATRAAGAGAGQWGG